MKTTSQKIDWGKVRSGIRSLGLSQAGVAEICGVSRESFNRMINGKYHANLSFDFVDSLAAVLKMTVYDLFEDRPHSAYYYNAAVEDAVADARSKVLESIARYASAMSREG